MKKHSRVVEPGGKVLVIAETYKGGRYDKLKWPVMWLLRASHLSADGHRELFAKAGYTDVEIVEEHDKGWICGIAGKPTNSSCGVETIFVPVDCLRVFAEPGVCALFSGRNGSSLRVTRRF